MGILDLLILAGLAVGAVRGFGTGALRQVAGLVGVLLAFLVALQLMEPAGEMVVSSLGVSERVGPLLGFLVVFLLVQALAYAVVRAARGLLKTLGLSFVDRIAGGALGALKAALLLSVLFLVLGTFEIPEQTVRRQSDLYGPVASVLPAAWSLVSDNWQEVESLAEKFEVPLYEP